MRLQLALDVADLDEAVDFYTKMFGTEPAKIRPGYANFAVADPPLKLVLFAHPATPAACSHDISPRPPPTRRGVTDRGRDAISR